MSDDVCTQERFLGDVKTHQMQIIQDDGVCRRIRFKRPETTCYHFDIITWPGYLCYSGDMGCYVFSRLEDMFEFFRTDRREEGKLGINTGYWAEKVQAQDKNGGLKKFSPEKFARTVREILADHEPDQSIIDSADEEIINRGASNEHEAYELLREFNENHGFEFTDFWEHDYQEFDYSFIWCCYALAWAIRQYDDHKKLAVSPA